MNAGAPYSSRSASPCPAAAERRYGALILQVTALILARDFSGILSVSREIGRAARALMQAKARASAARMTRAMLADGRWRGRVISDLGGYRALHLWQRARRRAALRAALLSLQSGGRGRAVSRAPLPPAEAARRAFIRERRRACAPARVFKDPFRMDFDGQFRLPPLPRAPWPAALRLLSGPAGRGSRAYDYDPRPVRRQNKYVCAQPVSPRAFYAAIAAEHALAAVKARAERERAAGRRRRVRSVRRSGAPARPARIKPRRQNRAPPARHQSL